MIYNLNLQMSFYQSAKDSTSTITKDLVEIRLQIRNGIYYHQVQNLRNQTTPEAYKQEKLKLPMFTASGIFSHRNDDLNNLVEYSNVIILDFDHFDTPQDAEDFKIKLSGYMIELHLYAIWISPSGLGVKAAMLHDNTNPADHLRMFHQIKNELYPNVPQFDMKCGNISRACFVSYDPDLIFHYDINRYRKLEPYHFVPNPSLIIPQSQPRVNNPNLNGSTQKPFEHTPEQLFRHRIFSAKEKAEFSLSRDPDVALADYLTKKWNKEHPDCYQDGNRHKSILARAKSFCEAGILVDVAINNLINTFGRHDIPENDIRDMVNYCYNTNEATWGSTRDAINEFRRKNISKRIDSLKNYNK